jgi:hypothetical protein
MAMAFAMAGTSALSAATLAADGKCKVTIVLAEGAVPCERTASEELAGYFNTRGLT